MFKGRQIPAKGGEFGGFSFFRGKERDAAKGSIRDQGRGRMRRAFGGSHRLLGINILQIGDNES